jgi:imidazolonepropionase-like amidohydrolase
MRYKVVVGFGTDLMGELERFQLGGLRVQHEVQGTLELLRSLTSRNAKILSFDKVGTLAVGNFGDLLILSKDPFKDPSTLWTLDSDRVTIKGGKTVE